MRNLDRRSMLKLMGGAVGAPMLYSCAGTKDEKPLIETLDTIVVLMMENRSFDHYYGAMSLVEGRRDIDGLTVDMFNRGHDGAAVSPYPSDVGCHEDLAHGWNSSRRQFNGGKNDGFVTQHEDDRGLEVRGRPMGYFDRRTLPAHYGIGGHFAICDRWFSSLMTSTWPNRFYLTAGQNNGIRNNAFEGDYSFFNIFDRMEQAGVPWSIYYGNISFSLLYPRQYPHDNFRELPRFFEDAAAGTLPNVVFLEPLYGRNDDHPPTHPLAGQVLIQSIYDALAKSPQWDRSMFVVTYDEHGGFYDHVPPPLAADEFADEGFDQLGFRVPAFVAGPWVKANHVEHTVFDHSSVIATIERLWGLRPLTIRDESASDLRVLLDEDRLAEGAPRPPLYLPRIDATEDVVYASECRYDIGFARPAVETFGQPELAVYFSEHLAGTSLDRRHKTDEVYEALLREAERRGVLRRSV